MAAIGEGSSMIPADNVVMGVPKKGRLYDRCMKLLAGAGMDHRRVRGGKRGRVGRERERVAVFLLFFFFFRCCCFFPSFLTRYQAPVYNT